MEAIPVASADSVSGSSGSGSRKLNVSMKKLTFLTVAILMIAGFSVRAADDAKPKQQRKAPTAEEIKKYDKDGDGKLSPEERKAMREDKKKEAPAK